MIPALFKMEWYAVEVRREDGVWRWKAYRIGWLIFMVLAVAPALAFSELFTLRGTLSSFADLQGSAHAIAHKTNRFFYIPESACILLMYPSAILAALFPSATTAIVSIFKFIGIDGHFGTAVIAALVRPPFYQPDTSGPHLKLPSFKKAVIGITGVVAVVEITFGLSEDPIMDSYGGDVYLSTKLANGDRVLRKVDGVTARFDLQKGGKGYHDSYTLQFSGTKTGIDAVNRFTVGHNLIRKDDTTLAAENRYDYCKLEPSRNFFNHLPGHLMNGEHDDDNYKPYEISVVHHSKESNCLKFFELGYNSFNELDLIIGSTSGSRIANSYLFVDMERDSKLGAITGLTMQLRGRTETPWEGY